MGLSLTAEQKSILKIFNIEERYVIPTYQRPYSWGYDQCYQLYKDLIGAYEMQEEYFIGNVIIAKSNNNKGLLEVIDGQQRLTTLLLIIKVFHAFHPEIKRLDEMLMQDDWEGNNREPRIWSKIFEDADKEYLELVLQYDLAKLEARMHACHDKNGQLDERKCHNKFEINILYFYDWFSRLKEHQGGSLKKLIKFFLHSIHLLPIELNGQTQEEASNRALVIFETLNNRGLSLEDADIFKARLYNKAGNKEEQQVFIESWKELKERTSQLRLEIDDIFRYYSHIVRGREKVTSNEIRLRDLFINKDYSPFNTGKSYKDIVNDLFKIVDVLELISSIQYKPTVLAKWLQLIEAYTNQYPKYALVAYFFKNVDTEEQLQDDEVLLTQTIQFLTALVRFVYYAGATRTIKWEVYRIIKDIFLGIDIKPYYNKETNTEEFDYLGRLKYSYALLAFYLQEKHALNNYTVDKILSPKDQYYLAKDWDGNKLDEQLNDLANFVVLDIPRRYYALPKKLSYYKTSRIKKVKKIGQENYSYRKFKERSKQLKSVLVDFFRGPITQM